MFKSLIFSSVSMVTYEELKKEYRGMSEYAMLVIADLLNKAASSPDGRLETQPRTDLWRGYIIAKLKGLMVDNQITEKGREAYGRFQSAGVYSDLDNRMEMARQEAIESRMSRQSSIPVIKFSAAKKKDTKEEVISF